MSWLATRPNLDRVLRAALPWAVNTALFALFFSLASPRYETNDGAAIMRIAAGHVTGQPSEYLIFTNVLIGKALVWLYTWHNDVNWYSCYLYAAHFLAMGLLLHVLLRRGSITTGLALYLILFTTFELRFLLLLQFTTTSAAVGTSGVLALASSRGPGGRKHAVLILAGICCVVLSAMIRIEVFYLLMLGAASFALVDLCKTRSARFLVCLGLAGGVSFGTYLCHWWYYAQNQEWRGFQRYSQVRGRVHGFTRLAYTQETAELYHNLGWSANDATAFQNWIFADKEVYSLARLEQLRDNFHESRWTAESIRDMFRRLPGYCSPHFWVTAFFAGLAWILSSGYRKDDVIAVAAMGAVGIGIVAYASLQRELPARVPLGLFFLVSATSALAIANRLRPKPDTAPERGVPRWYQRGIRFKMSLAIFARSPNSPETEMESPPRPSPATRPHRSVFLAKRGAITLKRIALWAMSLALAIATGLILLGNVVQNDENVALQAAYDRLVTSVKQDFVSPCGNAVLLDWSAAFPFEWSSCLSNYESTAQFGIVTFGWETNSPLVEAALANRSIKDPYRALYERRDVYALSRFDNQELVVKSIGEHLHQQVAYEVARFYPLTTLPGAATQTLHVSKFRRVTDESGFDSAPADQRGENSATPGE